MMINQTKKEEKEKKRKRNFYFKLLFKFVDLEFAFTLDYGNNTNHGQQARS